MAPSLDAFIQQIKDSRIVGESLADFIPPQVYPKDAHELAIALICSGKLTKYQAEVISKGKGQSLWIGDYQILESLGQGGMGEVFKACHIFDGQQVRNVAIKIISKKLLRDDKKARKRFVNEFMATAALNHTNWVRAYAAGTHGDTLFIVMELVNGCNLEKLVMKDGPLSVDAAVQIVLQAAEGLQAAHANDIVHRDITPRNLMLTPERCVKILDLGLARLPAVLNGNRFRSSSMNEAVGTVQYMSQEQFFGGKRVDVRSDIYSLGCTWHFLLTGKPPYDAPTVPEMFFAHKQAPIPSIRECRPDVPAYVDAMRIKMLGKEPQDRYQSMSEVIHALRSLAQRTTEHDTIIIPPVKNDVQPGRELCVVRPIRVIRLPSAATTSGIQGAFAYRKLGAWVLAFVLIFGMGMGIAKLSSGKAEEQTKVLNTVSQIEPHGKQRTADAAAESGPRVLPERHNPIDLTGNVVNRQFAHVKQEMERLNGSTANMRPQIDDDNRVIGLTLVSDDVSDISPLRDLPDLRSLMCIPTNHKGGSIRSLQPLSGLQLNRLICPSSPGISDISPLSGMPLSELDIAFTEVNDLSPLRNIKLTTLLCNGTSVSDLSPLDGTMLSKLNCGQTNVSDLRSLSGMKLQDFDCGFTHVEDLLPLQGMPLKVLSIIQSDVTDLSVLKGLPLEKLGFTPQRIKKGLNVVRDMPTLKTIHVYWKSGYFFSAADFWRRYDAGEFSGPEPSN